eukprot:PLAT3280.29.p1 GENE.PLAT3280.29~~PLAT3280.29.p1  ORF type:complete len:965 (-),score=326.23 PLAT3280.29:686-3391(-)
MADLPPSSPRLEEVSDLSSIPDSLIPEEDHVTERYPLPPRGLARPGAHFDESSREWVIKVFPSQRPTEREEVRHLSAWLQQKLQQLPVDVKPVEALSARHSVFSVALHECVRQVSASCVERGALLASIWQQFMDVYEQLLAVVNPMRDRVVVAETKAVEAATALKETQEQLEAVEKMLRLADDREEKSAAELAFLRKSAKEKTGRIAALVQEVQRGDWQRDELMATIKQLEEDAPSYKQARVISRLERELAEMAEARRTLEEELSSRGRKIQEQSEVRAGMALQIQGLKDDRERAAMRLSVLREELDVSEDRVTELEQTLRNERIRQMQQVKRKLDVATQTVASGYSAHAASAAAAAGAAAASAVAGVHASKPGKRKRRSRARTSKSAALGKGKRRSRPAKPKVTAMQMLTAYLGFRPPQSWQAALLASSHKCTLPLPPTEELRPFRKHLLALLLQVEEALQASVAVAVAQPPQASLDRLLLLLYGGQCGLLDVVGAQLLVLCSSLAEHANDCRVLLFRRLCGISPADCKPEDAAADERPLSAYALRYCVDVLQLLLSQGDAGLPLIEGDEDVRTWLRLEHGRAALRTIMDARGVSEMSDYVCSRLLYAIHQRMQDGDTWVDVDELLLGLVEDWQRMEDELALHVRSVADRDDSSNTAADEMTFVEAVALLERATDGAVAWNDAFAELPFSATLQLPFAQVKQAVLHALLARRLFWLPPGAVRPASLLLSESDDPLEHAHIHSASYSLRMQLRDLAGRRSDALRPLHDLQHVSDTLRKRGRDSVRQARDLLHRVALQTVVIVQGNAAADERASRIQRNVRRWIAQRHFTRLRSAVQTIERCAGVWLRAARARKRERLFDAELDYADCEEADEAEGSEAEEGEADAESEDAMGEGAAVVAAV